MKGSVDDLDTPVYDLLRRLPGVAKVSIHKPVDRPTHRIVHLTDWHFLPKDLFAADIRDVAGEPVSDAEIDDLYEKVLLESLLYQHRRDLLRIGAAGQLFMAGELEEVVPADDEELLARANPVAEDGKVTLDRAVIEARQDAQVRAMLEGGPFALVILGGAHDLADNVVELAGRDGEYVRVMTRWGRKFGVGRGKSLQH